MGYRIHRGIKDIEYMFIHVLFKCTCVNTSMTHTHGKPTRSTTPLNGCQLNELGHKVMAGGSSRLRGKFTSAVKSHLSEAHNYPLVI